MNRTARRRNAATSRTEPVTETVEAATIEVSGVETEAPYKPDPIPGIEGFETAPAKKITGAHERSLLAQLRDWLATVPDDHPYDGLVRLAREAGWDWLVREAAVVPGPQYEYLERTESGERLRTGATVIVSFDVLIGRTGMDASLFTAVDRATIALPAVPGPVSVAARAQISETIIYMIFGRLPPQRQAAAPAPVQEERVVEMADEDVELSGDEPMQMNGRDDDIEPMITGADVPPWEPGAGLPDVVVERVDGVPVFADLDDVQAPSGDVIVAVTNEINAALVKMTTVDQVMDMWNRNAAVFNWLQDFATPEQRTAIAGAFKRRRGQIEAGYGNVVPGRRQAVN